MPSIIDSLPAWARASTTGQGLAGLVATGAAAIASHYTANQEIVGGVGVLAAAVVLILFPQATGAPPAASVLAADIRPMVEAYTAGLRHGAAMAPSGGPGALTERLSPLSPFTPPTPVAPPIGVVPVSPTEKKDTVP